MRARLRRARRRGVRAWADTKSVDTPARRYEGDSNFGAAARRTRGRCGGAVVLPGHGARVREQRAAERSLRAVVEPTRAVAVGHADGLARSLDPGRVGHAVAPRDRAVLR